MLEGKDYKELDEVIPFVAALIDRSTKHEKTAPMTRVRTWYSEIVFGVTGYMENRVWTEEELVSLERTIKEFKKMLLETIDEHYNFCQYTLKYYLLDHMVDHIQKFETLSVLGSSAYDHFNVLIKQSTRRSLQRRQSRMMETVKVLERNYERVLPYGKWELMRI